MSETNVLSKFRDTIFSQTDSKSLNDAFDELCVFIDNNYLNKTNSLPKTIVDELIEIGDYIKENNIEITSKRKESFDIIYEQLKTMFNKDFDFIEDSKQILYSLNAQEVRQVETFYKILTKITLDFNVKISYKDGMIFSCEVPLISLSDTMRALEVKALIGRAIRNGAIFVVDYLDFDEGIVATTGFVFDDEEFYPLKTEFLKTIHKNDSLGSQEFFTF